MAWVLLVLAGLFEIGWAVSMKYADGLTRPGPTAITILASIVSFLLLALAMKTLPLGTAYAVWTGIGVVGSAILGIVLFHESRNLPRLACIAMIVIGIVGLKLTMSTAATP
ncbi:MAG: quaternary ammonium compound efflux SMR transporter SugE [Planctomycetes bacterium]|nr:quaternary ammonium compound efflux SMR transporter SugE [Planctomycetota bacterium]